jgi:hypothetical protein
MLCDPLYYFEKSSTTIEIYLNYNSCWNGKQLLVLILSLTYFCCCCIFLLRHDLILMTEKGDSV